MLARRAAAILNGVNGKASRCMGLVPCFATPPLDMDMLVVVPFIADVDLLPAAPALEPIKRFALGSEST